MTDLRTPPRAATGRPESGTLLVLEHLLLTWRKFWSSSLINSVLTPLVFLLALGVGLGSLVDRGGGRPLGVGYLDFVGPALMVATAAETGMGEASWPTLTRFKWAPTYRAMCATPITPRQVADGTVLFTVLRMAAAAVLYWVFLVLFGAGGGVRGLLMVPVALLTGLSGAVWVLVMAARLRGEGTAFNLVFRFVLMPLTLFSGSFFPVARMPLSVRWIAWISPLWHGNELARGVELGRLPLGPAVGHAAVLLVLVAVGLHLARRAFADRLVE